MACHSARRADSPSSPGQSAKLARAELNAAAGMVSWSAGRPGHPHSLTRLSGSEARPRPCQTEMMVIEVCGANAAR